MNFNRLLISALPNALWLIKRVLIKKSVKSVGADVRFGPNTFFAHPENVIIGNNVFLSDGAVISTIENLKIGDHVMFGPQVMIMGGDHNISEVGRPMIEVKHGGVNLPIVIENDVWVGARATILKGVTIAEGSVIGACAMVTKSTLPYSINTGSPAKAVKCRFSAEELKTHIEAVKSDYSAESIIKLYQEKGIEL